MTLSVFDWITIALFFIVTFGIGFYYSRKETTARDYFLAGNKAGWFAVGASIFATNISSEHFIGLAGSGAAGGLPVAAYELAAVFCLFTLGWVFLPYYLKSKVYTMPEFLERRFNPESRWILTTISLLAYVFTKISVALFAGAILFKAVIGWPPLISAVFLVIATGVYTVTGGLSAVIYTNTMQAIVLIGGSVVLTLTGLAKVGGFEGLRASLPPDFFHMIKPASDMVYPWTGTTFGIFILGVWYFCTDQVIVQRALGAKNLAHARLSTFFAAALKLLPLFILVLPGLIARVLWPQELQADPDMAYPLIVTRLMPVGLSGLMIAALLAALMSSLSAVFNSCSTLITMDVYRKFRPNASEKSLVSFGRWATVVIVIVSIAWIPMIRLLSDQIFLYLQSVQSYVGAPITAVFLTGILWKRATGKAAVITLVTGLVIGMTRLTLDILGKTGMTDFGPLNILTGYSFLNYCAVMFLICVAMIIVISYLTKEPPQNKTDGLVFSTETMSTGISRGWTITHIALSILIALTTIIIWAHFA